MKLSQEEIMQKIVAKELIVFDFDGTIASLEVNWSEARARVQREVLDSHGLRGCRAFVMNVARLNEVANRDEYLRATDILAELEMDATLCIPASRIRTPSKRSSSDPSPKNVVHWECELLSKAFTGRHFDLKVKVINDSNEDQIVLFCQRRTQ